MIAPEIAQEFGILCVARMEIPMEMNVNLEGKPATTGGLVLQGEANVAQEEDLQRVGQGVLVMDSTTLAVESVKEKLQIAEPGAT